MVEFCSAYFNVIYNDIAQKLIKEPEHVITNRKDEKVFEMIDCGFTLFNPINCFATIRPMSLKYLKGELEFYMSGSPFLTDIEKHSKFWRTVSDDDRTINSNYGKILLFDRNCNNYTQFEYALNMLVRNKDSKKAVMVIYSPDNGRVSNDNPCTMYIHFFIRNNRLDMYVKMRSSDIYFGLPYDVPFFVLIQYRMLFHLWEYYPDITIGMYHHQAGSLHVYERNLETLRDGMLNDEHPAFYESQDNLFTDYLYEPYLVHLHGGCNEHK